MNTDTKKVTDKSQIEYIYSDGNVDVGATLKHNIMVKNNLSISRLAELLKTTRPSLYNIFANKYKLTPNMVVKIKIVFDIYFEELLTIQMDNDLAYEWKINSSDFTNLKPYKG